jgi:hypothetical protein
MHIPDSIRQELPGIAGAFDGQLMRGHLQAALFDAARARFSVESCTPDKPLYTPGKHCSVQYEVQAKDLATGAVLEVVVVGRVFPDRARCAAYVAQRLRPLVARARDRADLATFATPAATIEPLDMCVHVLPLDAELPALIEVTDPRRMVEVLRNTLPPRLLRNSPAAADCRIELVSYRRRQRCVLRYTIADNGRPLIVYGKLAPLRRGPPYGEILEPLRAHFARGERFTIPRLLGCRPELGLALLEEVPGEAAIGPALRARLCDRPSPSGGQSLNEMLATCARLAAALHGSGLRLGAARTLDDELEARARDVELTRPFAPALAERASGWLQVIVAHARRSEPLPACLCHGDFKLTQLLFDGPRTGMVDFDTICLAEPALDLGHFLAYLGTQIQKIQRGGKAGAAPHDLGEWFLREYLAAAGVDERRLRSRIAIYEVVSLLRMALHSRQKFQDVRLDGTAALLEERMRLLC